MERSSIALMPAKWVCEKLPLSLLKWLKIWNGLKGLKMYHKHRNSKNLLFFFMAPLSPDNLRYNMLTLPYLSYKLIGNHVSLQFLLHLGKPLSQTKPLNSELLPTYTFCACNICCDVASRKLTMLCFKLLEHEASV